MCSADIRTQPTLVDIFGRARGQGLLHSLVELKCCNPTPLHFSPRVFPPAGYIMCLCGHERPATSLIVGTVVCITCKVILGIMVCVSVSLMSKEYTVRVVNGFC